MRLLLFCFRRSSSFLKRMSFSSRKSKLAQQLLSEESVPEEPAGEPDVLTDQDMHRIMVQWEAL